MNSIEKAILRCGQLSRALEKFPAWPIWVFRARIDAAALLCAVDSDWEGGPEDLLQIILAQQAGLPVNLARVAAHSFQAAAYVLLQAEAALPVARDLRCGVTGLPRGRRRNQGPELTRWLAEVKGVERTVEGGGGGMPGLIDRAWRVGTAEVRRSALLVGTGTALRKRFGLGAEAPGIWGVIPQEAERRTRFRVRFAVALAKQCERAIESIDRLDDDLASVKQRLDTMRSTPRLPCAAEALVARRVLSPALLKSDLETDGLACSWPAVSKILDALVRNGIAVEITKRSSYRRFVLASDLEARAVLEAAAAGRRAPRRTPPARRRAEPEKLPLFSREPDPLPGPVGPEVRESIETSIANASAVNARASETLRRYGYVGGTGAVAVDDEG